MSKRLAIFFKYVVKMSMSKMSKYSSMHLDFILIHFANQGMLIVLVEVIGKVKMNHFVHFDYARIIGRVKMP